MRMVSVWRLDKFTRGASKISRLGTDTWLRIRQEVRTDVLLLLPKRQAKEKRRKTVDVGDRLLTEELLVERGQVAQRDGDGESAVVSVAVV